MIGCRRHPGMAALLQLKRPGGWRQACLDCIVEAVREAGGHVIEGPQMRLSENGIDWVSADLGDLEDFLNTHGMQAEPVG